MGYWFETFVFYFESEGSPDSTVELGNCQRSFDFEYRALWLNEAFCRLEAIVRCEESFDYTDHYASDSVSLLWLTSYFQNTSDL